MSEKINKDDLALEIHENYGLTKRMSRDIVDHVFDRTAEVISNKGEVSIFGFGKFETRHREERGGFNPSTKEKITLPASTTPVFKPSQVLKDLVDK